MTEGQLRLELIKKYADDIISTYEKKNRNYKGSFTKTIEELGMVAGLVPIYNKIHRATSLLTGEINNFESIDDTLRDLATYALMLLAELELTNKTNEKACACECTCCGHSEGSAPSYDKATSEECDCYSPDSMCGMWDTHESSNSPFDDILG